VALQALPQLPLPSFGSIPQPEPIVEPQVSFEEPESPPADRPTHALNARVSQRTIRRIEKYHRLQKVFLTALRDTPVATEDAPEFQRLFQTRRHQITGDADEVATLKGWGDYEKAADIVRRSPTFQPNPRLLHPLRRTIRYRQKAQKWFSRLNDRDHRRKRTKAHWRFIEILLRVYETLNGGRAYSPRRH